MIKLKPNPFTALNLYLIMFLIVFVVFAGNSVLLAVGDDYGILSSGMGVRLAILAVLAAVVLISPFMVLYFSDRAKTWIGTEQGVRIESKEGILLDVSWEEVKKVSLAPHGISLLLKGKLETIFLL